MARLNQSKDLSSSGVEFEVGSNFEKSELDENYRKSESECLRLLSIFPSLLVDVISPTKGKSKNGNSVITNFIESKAFVRFIFQVSICGTQRLQVCYNNNI